MPTAPGTSRGPPQGTPPDLTRKDPVDPKTRSYTLLLVALCLLLWAASFLAYMGSEWLHTRQRPRFIEVVPRPPHTILALTRGSGAVAIFLGAGGWWGALHRRHLALFVFSCATFLTSVLELSCGAVALSYARKSALLMRQDVARNLQGVLDPYANDTTSLFLELQERIHCCGVLSYQDWVGSPWWRAQREANTSLVVPLSCCARKPREVQCNSGSPPYEEVSFPDLMHGTGCVQRLSDYMDSLFYTTGSLAFTGGCVKLVGFFLMHVLLNFMLRRRQELLGDVEESGG